MGAAARARPPSLDQLEDHLDVSLEDFEPSIGSRSPRSDHHYSDYPSSSYSDEEEEGSEIMEDSSASAGGFFPPAWPGDRHQNWTTTTKTAAADKAAVVDPPAMLRLLNGDHSQGFWSETKDQKDTARLEDFAGGRGGGYFDDLLLRESSPEDEKWSGDPFLYRAIRTALPRSQSPEEKEERSSEEDGDMVARQLEGEHDGSRNKVEIKREEEGEEDVRLGDIKDAGAAGAAGAAGDLLRPQRQQSSENYIRFAVQADIQQRTEPIEAAINFLRTRVGFMFVSWPAMLLSTIVAILSYAAIQSLFQPASMRPVPDLVKVAGVARSFEPLIYYSENGIQQVGDLQATGVAVWDLGESVRSSNLTSAPIIVKELDELSDSLKTLAIELTKFFANVDGDIDGILIVMDWARRELSQLSQLPSAPLSSAFDNIHNMLSRAGVLENPATGQPTTAGTLALSLFGPSRPQRTKQTLQRTFHEFLAVLEEAIANELQHSLAIFALFEAIDNQFLNLARTVVREASQQDEAQDELLSSLWTRILGANAGDLKKYERNRMLLLNVREKTVRNKGILVEHNHRLMALKASLESVRRKLVSPLVRSVNSSTLSVEEQIRGLEDVGVYLEGVRTRQKGKLMEVLYGGGGGG
ncbi:hypothetical protein B0T17DRAFT_632921 [Bombardia bombarda]|uniref:Uncharacterized protein n=1 Tax=Bombardia bombarda TaxID=252184 RepID=A0AA40C7W8_9PEZI|nr:hypothetical protein B0T17DRAFT_632921 [Bombardia bombarda]